MATPQRHANAPNPPVDLNAIVQRIPVALDGETYQIRDFREFSYLAYRQQLEDCARLGALLERSPENPKEAREREELLDRFCRHILIAPAPVQDRLVIQQRVEIVRCFFNRAARADVEGRHDDDDTAGREADWDDTVPALVRFYGGSPWYWLAEAPLILVHGFQRAMPRLTAREALQDTARISAGAWGNAQLTQQWRALGFPQDVPARDLVEHHARRRAAIQESGVRVFRPKDQ